MRAAARTAALCAFLALAPAGAQAAETVTVGSDLSQTPGAAPPCATVPCTVFSNQGLTVAKVPFDGTLTSWRIRHDIAFGGPLRLLRLKVVREAFPGLFVSVYTGPVQDFSNQNGTIQFTDSVAVREGDFIGADLPSGSQPAFGTGLITGEGYARFDSPELSDGQAARAPDAEPTNIGLLMNASIVRAESSGNLPSEAPVPSAAGPEPEPGRTVVSTPFSGTVLVRLPGTNRFIRLVAGLEVPNGTVFDTRKGVVVITSSDGRGGTQSAFFYEGIFEVEQRRAPITDITLVEKLPFRRGCPTSPRSRARAAKKGPERHVWGRGKGRFRSNGNNSSSTVRGTTWLVSDRCSGTLTRVREGVVDVRDRIAHRTVTVRAGKSYLARNR